MNCKIIGVDDSLWLHLLETIAHDFYHLPNYVRLEARRIKAIPKAIVISHDDRIFFLPYLQRQIEPFDGEQSNFPELFDLISPYGYPGILLNEPASKSSEFLKLALDELINRLCQQNICSAFLRLHPLINRDYHQIFSPQICHLGGQTISIDLTSDKQQILSQTRSRFRTQINKSIRDGFEAKIVNFRDYLDEFREIYWQTMTRLRANKIYFFDRNYFIDLLNLEENIHLCIVKFKDEIACAGLFTECGEIVQYHLGGTKDKFVEQSPSKLMLHYVRFWAKERGNKVLHLGGGLGGSSQDSLYYFKSGFSQQTNSYSTLRLIIDREKYDRLLRLRAKHLNLEPQTIIESNFFPSYRYQI